MVTRPHDVTGAALLLSGIALVVRAQLELGASWRVGIDLAARPGLVVHGLYALSRNPIFLGLLVAVAGVTLLVPTWLSIATLVGSALAIRSQVLGEEAYLRQTYDAEYLAYASKVGRFVPWLGRLEGP